MREYMGVEMSAEVSNFLRRHTARGMEVVAQLAERTLPALAATPHSHRAAVEAIAFLRALPGLSLFKREQEARRRIDTLAAASNELDGAARDVVSSLSEAVSGAVFGPCTKGLMSAIRGFLYTRGNTAEDITWLDEKTKEGS